jgi:hypothetical protein
MNQAVSAAIRIAAALCSTVVSISAAQLVANGGFETGNFDGWTQSGNTANTGVDTFSPHSGTFSAFLGPSGTLGFLDQVLPTVTGTSYELSFFLESDGGTPNEFRAQVNSTTVFDQTNIPLQPYTQKVFDFVATATTDLRFGFRDDPGFLRLDDITVNSLATAIPEPSSLYLMGSAVVIAAVRRRRRRTNSREERRR